MKVAVISDLHFGDAGCVLVEEARTGWCLRARVAEQLEWLKTVDVLVLLGDIFDFSIAEYQEAFAAATPFFNWLKNGDRLKQIVYCPGNHDAMLWHVLEYETRVVRSLANPAERKAKPLRSALPCVIDTTKASVTLPGIDRPGSNFLTDFIGISTLVGYPNVYLVTPEGTMLLTHGHYFESYWAIFAEIVQRFGGDDYKTHPVLKIPPVGEVPTLKQLVDFNHPLVSLACMGIGQAGDLTIRARQVQREAKNVPIVPGMLLDKYLERAREWAGTIYHPGPKPAHWYDLKDQAKYAEQRVVDAAVDKALDWAFTWLRGQINGTTSARKAAAAPDIKSWLTHAAVNPRFDRYMEAATVETKMLGIAAPTACTIGHTHTHEVWPTAVQTAHHGMIACCNTGGWLVASEAFALVWDGAYGFKKAL